MAAENASSGNDKETQSTVTAFLPILNFFNGRIQLTDRMRSFWRGMFLGQQIALTSRSGPDEYVIMK